MSLQPQRRTSGAMRRRQRVELKGAETGKISKGTDTTIIRRRTMEQRIVQTARYLRIYEDTLPSTLDASKPQYTSIGRSTTTAS